VPHPSRDEVRRQLEEVLSRPEFSPGARSGWLADLFQRLADFLGWLGALRHAAPVLFWLLLAGCLLLLALLLGHIIWTVRRVLFVRGRAGAGEKAEERRSRLSGACEEEARRRAAAADFTEAIRYLFLALVYRFDESGRASFQRAWTNREYLELFAGRPPVQARLRVFVDTLDDYWYGQRPTDRRQYEDCLALYQGLVRA
jgi:hypothetical protein